MRESSFLQEYKIFQYTRFWENRHKFRLRAFRCDKIEYFDKLSSTLFQNRITFIKMSQFSKLYLSVIVYPWLIMDRFLNKSMIRLGDLFAMICIFALARSRITSRSFGTHSQT